jgi:FAD/FMN-containing dehydrogenase
MKPFIDSIEQAIVGEMSINPIDLTYYSTDGGIFELRPTAVVFPNDTIDVQTLVKTVNHLNETGKETISLTARGNGTDQGGGPINSGVIVDFTRHMNQILEIGDGYALVQPGCIYEHLQNELRKTGQYIPSYPASVGVCTIGGAVANNAAGEKTVKYGATRQYVEAIQVVLADGSMTWLYPMNHHELDIRIKLPTLEGAIYRQIVELLDANYDAIHNDHPHVTKESSGYALWEVRKQQKFNLAQIVIGSQGTLCLVTAIRLTTVPVPDAHKVTLIVSYYDDIHKVSQASKRLHGLHPSALEIVDQNLLRLVSKQQPDLLTGLLPVGEIPAFILLTEFDDADDQLRQQNEVDALTILAHYASGSTVEYTPEQEARSWKLRRSAAAIMWTIPGARKALPIIEDGTVPPHKLDEFLTRSYEIFTKYDLEIAVWGHAGDADLHMQPFMDLSKAADRKKIFSMTDEFYAMVHELGGTAAGEHNDSLMRAPYRSLMFGPVLEDLFNQVKCIFDAHNVLNPHKKVGVDFNYVKQHIRHEYSIKSLAHLASAQARDKIDR